MSAPQLGASRAKRNSGMGALGISLLEYSFGAERKA